MRTTPLVLSAALLLPACFQTGATRAEMREAVLEVVAQGQAQSLENEVVELTTDFTIGGAIEEIAQHVKDFVESQVDCSTVTVAGNTVEIDLGTLEDNCQYNGHTFAGKITLEFAYDKTATEVIVDHTYTGVTNGEVTLDGTATVTWGEGSRRIVHDFDWTADGRELHASGDRTQTLLDPDAGLAGGVEIDGTRRWEGEKGTWDLAIDGVEVRWIDPVPQAGSYTLTTPAGKEIVMSFARLDDDTIEVRVSGGRRDRVFRVSSAGAVDEQGDA